MKKKYDFTKYGIASKYFDMMISTFVLQPSTIYIEKKGEKLKKKGKISYINVSD